MSPLLLTPFTCTYCYMVSCTNRTFPSYAHTHTHTQSALYFSIPQQQQGGRVVYWCHLLPDALWSTALWRRHVPGQGVGEQHNAERQGSQVPV